MGSQLPPSSYLIAEDAWLIPAGQGSGLSTGEKATEAAFGLLCLASSGAEECELGESDKEVAGTTEKKLLTQLRRSYEDSSLLGF